MRWGGKRSPEEHAATGMVPGELPTLRAALDHVPYGVVLLDSEMRAQFINRAFRKMWRMPDSKADGKPAFVALMYHGRDTRAYDVPESELDAYVARRVAYVKAGNPTPVDVRLHSGEIIRFQCTVLPAGGRMLSYTYVTDIVRHSDELEVLRVALDNVEQGVILLDADLNAAIHEPHRPEALAGERRASRPQAALCRNWSTTLALRTPTRYRRLSSTNSSPAALRSCGPAIQPPPICASATAGSSARNARCWRAAAAC